MDALWAQISGFFLAEQVFWPSVAGSVLAFLMIAYFGLPFIFWVAAGLVVLAGFGAPVWLAIAFAVISVIFLVPPVRAVLISGPLMNLMKAAKMMPQISATERTALEAGVVWMEKELFSGHPNFKTMLDQPVHALSAEEQSFLDNEVEQLCEMVDEYKYFRTKEMDPKVWEFIRRKGFLGMIIPKEFGGKGFSHSMHSAVIQKISSRSIGTVIYVMVPNSLGPAELLVPLRNGCAKEKVPAPAWPTATTFLASV
jgi:acyl-CoA dehydrogenase